MRRPKVRTTLLVLSGFLFPVTFFYLSPVVILAGASEGIVTGSFVVFGVLFLSALAFGRAFCGWVCPGGAIAGAAGRLRDRPLTRGWARWGKFGIWAPWLGAIALFAVQAGGLRRVEFTYMTWHGISVATWEGLIAFALVTLVIAGLTPLVGRRGFCHTLCWMAPFMVLGRAVANLARLPALRLRARQDKCVGCGACTRVCPMSLDVQRMVESGNLEQRDCILCARCADRCPKGVIGLRIAPPPK